MYSIAYQFILALTLGITLGVSVYAWRQRPKHGAGSVALINAATFLWTLCTLFVTLTTGDTRAIFGRLIIPAAATTVYGLVVFALAYTGRDEWLSARTYGLLAIEPLVVTVLSLTSGSQDLFWTVDTTVREPTVTFLPELGVGFWIHAAYSYVLLAVVTVILVTFIVRSNQIYERQLLAALAAMFAPWIGDTLSTFEVVSVQLAPVTFAFTATVLAWAATSTDFLDLTPVARNRVLETIDAGVFVVDTEGRIRDCNGQARALFGLEEEPVVGTAVSALLSSFPEVKRRYNSISDTEQPATEQFTIDDRTYRVRVSPLFRRDRLVARVFLVNDITGQVERQRRLQRQNRQLEQFASVVSHDLQNPLTVANNAVELARETDNTDHLDTVVRSHERMEQLIEDLLALARADADTLAVEEIDLGEAVQMAWGSVVTEGVLLRNDATGTVDADRTQLRRLLENAIRNAVEHGGETVRVGTLDDGFYIEDDGPGIPEDERESVFEQGYTNSAEGTGLGLAIVHAITAAHGWEIEVTEGDDGGARFVVTTVDGNDSDSY